MVRKSERSGYANRDKARKIDTLAGTLMVQVPKSRGGDAPFYPQALERGRRSSRTVMLAIAQMDISRRPGRVCRRGTSRRPWPNSGSIASLPAKSAAPRPFWTQSWKPGAPARSVPSPTCAAPCLFVGPATRRSASTAWCGLDLSNTVYAPGSTTIDLCLSVFPWAHFRTTKAAAKMHTLLDLWLDLRGSIPRFIPISDGKLHDVHALDLLMPEAGAIYIMDRAYIDFERLHALRLAGAFFVTRAKSNMDAHRVYSALSNRSSGIICDQTIAMDGVQTKRNYPEHLRRLRFRAPESGRTLVFITNNFTLPATTICALYKSPLAGGTVLQVDQAASAHQAVLRHPRKRGEDAAVDCRVRSRRHRQERLGLDASLYTLLQVLSVTLFEKMPLNQALAASEPKSFTSQITNQLDLFAF
jgi:hypothetical protein